MGADVVVHRSSEPDARLNRTCRGCSEEAGEPVSWPCRPSLEETRRRHEEFIQRRDLERGEVAILARVEVGWSIQSWPGFEWRMTRGGTVIGHTFIDDSTRQFKVVGFGSDRKPYWVEIDEPDVDPAGCNPPNAAWLLRLSDQVADLAKGSQSPGWKKKCYDTAACLAAAAG